MKILITGGAGFIGSHLVEALLTIENLPAPVKELILQKAHGNPFFVEEMLRALQETGGLIDRDGEIKLAPRVRERLPTTLTEVLLARLDRLDAQARDVVQVASVIGRSFGVRILAQVMERDEAELEIPLTTLQQAEIAV